MIPGDPDYVPCQAVSGRCSVLFPAGGLAAQQANTQVGSGRLATLMPALRNEFFLTRFSARLRDTGRAAEVVPQNAPISAISGSQRSWRPD
jgi:hypothetical protein